MRNGKNGHVSGLGVCARNGGSCSNTVVAVVTDHYRG